MDFSNLIFICLSFLAVSHSLPAPNSSIGNFDHQNLDEEAAIKLILQLVAERVILEERQGQSRQEASGEEDETPAALPVPLPQTGANVAQILAGVFTGNFTSLFAGSSGFIFESDVRQNVGAILTGIGDPLTLFWQAMMERVGNYFGFTTPTQRPMSNGTTTAEPEPLNTNSSTISTTTSATEASSSSTTTKKPVPTEVTETPLNQTQTTLASKVELYAETTNQPKESITTTTKISVTTTTQKAVDDSEEFETKV